MTKTGKEFWNHSHLLVFNKKKFILNKTGRNHTVILRIFFFPLRDWDLYSRPINDGVSPNLWTQSYPPKSLLKVFFFPLWDCAMTQTILKKLCTTRHIFTCPAHFYRETRFGSSEAINAEDLLVLYIRRVSTVQSKSNGLDLVVQYLCHNTFCGVKSRYCATVPCSIFACGAPLQYCRQCGSHKTSLHVPCALLPRN